MNISQLRGFFLPDASIKRLQSAAICYLWTHFDLICFIYTFMKHSKSIVLTMLLCVSREGPLACVQYSHWDKIQRVLTAGSCSGLISLEDIFCSNHTQTGYKGKEVNLKRFHCVAAVTVKSTLWNASAAVNVLLCCLRRDKPSYLNVKWNRTVQKNFTSSLLWTVSIPLLAINQSDCLIWAVLKTYWSSITFNNLII